MTRGSRTAFGCLLLVISMFGASLGRAESLVEVTATDPAGDAFLAPRASLYLRIQYQLDEPLRLWARPFRDGRQVEKAFTNASRLHSGAGETLAWFALQDAGIVDEVRIIAGGGSPYREWVIARVPLNATWTYAQARDQPHAEWVETLRQAEAELQRQEARQRAQEPASVVSILLFNGFMLLMFGVLLAGIVVPVWAAWKWRGGWRIAAAAPAAVMALVVLRIVIDGVLDPTSHNLWPFEILMVGVPALAVVGVLFLARRLRGVR